MIAVPRERVTIRPHSTRPDLVLWGTVIGLASPVQEGRVFICEVDGVQEAQYVIEYAISPIEAWQHGHA